MAKEFTPDEKAVKARHFHLANQLAFLATPIDPANKEIIHWEELRCVGYNPAQSRIEAIVSIKQTTGYSGNLCTNGSTEYVRFFIDWGTGFTDLGFTSFKVYDIDDPSGANHPLQYMVQYNLDDESHRRICFSPVLPRLRAVLSWNTIPSSNPFDPVVYGNAREVNIQLEAKPWFLFDLLEVHKIALDSSLVKHLDLYQPIASQAKKTIPFAELRKQYVEAKVPDHRFFYNAVYTALKPQSKPNSLAADFSSSYFAEAKINLDALAEILFGKQTSTEYEELTCVGLNSERDTLGAVIHVKKRSGYNGSLCYRGSNEYVAFWADWDNDGSYDEYLGTAKVEVHDIGTMPADGLFYCVSLPLNVAQRLRICRNPNVIGIRAVLSWETLPSTTDPQDLNYWGNRLDAKVLIRKRNRIGTDIDFHFHDIGNVPFSDINAGFAFFNVAASPYHNRPWGGVVHIGGRFANAGPAGNVHYRVEWSNTNSSNPLDWQPVSTSESFQLYNPSTGFYDNVVTQVSPDGWFSYLEDFSGGNVIDEYTALLANWNTGTKQGIHYLRVLYTTDHTHATYTATAAVALTINNIQYEANTAFHNYLSGGAVLSAAHTVDMIFDGAGGCISAPVGQAFTGHFKAQHQYFAKTALYVLPPGSQAVLSSGPITTPPSGTLERLSPSTLFSGFANEAWSMNTASMHKCGYVLVLEAYERTIYNSSLYLTHKDVSIGFAIV